MIRNSTQADQALNLSSLTTGNPNRQIIREKEQITNSNIQASHINRMKELRNCIAMHPLN